MVRAIKGVQSYLMADLLEGFMEDGDNLFLKNKLLIPENRVRGLD